MRLGVVVFAGLAVAAMALQSVVGPARDATADGSSTPPPPLHICEVEAAIPPGLRVEHRSFEAVPAHTELSITPAQFGTETEAVILTPAHREGASFTVERRMVIVSEPTRRLTVVPAEFGDAPALTPANVRSYRVVDGRLVAYDLALEPMPRRKVLRQDASISAVRLSPGIEMITVRTLLKDGDGAPVAAEKRVFERRIVLEPPSVQRQEVPVQMTSAEVAVVETAASTARIPALCGIESDAASLDRLRTALIERDAFTGPAEGGWTLALVDALAEWQTGQIGIVAPALLPETAAILLPDLPLPSV